jgi:hypothetical protein
MLRVSRAFKVSEIVCNGWEIATGASGVVSPNAAVSVAGRSVLIWALALLLGIGVVFGRTVSNQSSAHVREFVSLKGVTKGRFIGLHGYSVSVFDKTVNDNIVILGHLLPAYLTTRCHSVYKSTQLSGTVSQLLQCL